MSPDRLDEMMAKISHRRYILLLEWLDQESKDPKLTDYYLMRLMGHVDRVLAGKDAPPINLDHYRIEFKDRDEKPSAPPLSQEDREALERQSLLASLGLLGAKIKGLDKNGMPSDE